MQTFSNTHAAFNLQMFHKYPQSHLELAHFFQGFLAVDLRGLGFRISRAHIITTRLAQNSAVRGY
jgi:hypothetical protein